MAPRTRPGLAIGAGQTGRTLGATRNPTRRSPPIRSLLRSRTALVLTGLAILALAITTLVSPGAADAQERRPATDRIAGQTREATAVAISEATWGRSEPDAVFIANSRSFPDALAAPSLAGTFLGPILLVEHDEIPDVVSDELGRLSGVQQAFVLGGEDAVDPSVERELEDRYGADAVERVAGPTRYETAAEVARAVDAASGIGTIDGARTVFLAAGTDFPDALAVGPAAYERRLPVLLTEPNQLHDATRQVIEELDIAHVVIAGGPLAVSDEVAAAVDDDDTSVERLAGRDRTDTAVDVAVWELTHLGYDRGQLLLARGDAFPDSLAVAPLAASRDAPILLTRNVFEVSYDLLQFLVNAGGITERITAIGGPDALASATLGRAAEAAKQPLRTIAYFTGTQGDVDGYPYFSEHVDWSLTDQRGWSLNNDYRYSQVSDPDAAELRIWLASPEVVENAAPGCDAAWSCTVGDDVYINEDNWDHATAEWSAASLDEYRHYVAIHEVGHWVGFGHVECSEYWGADDDGRPAPVMEQQSIDAGDCVINTWPLTQDAPGDPWGQGDQSEFSRAYDLYPQGDSAPPSTASASTSDQDGPVRVFVE